MDNFLNYLNKLGGCLVFLDKKIAIYEQIFFIEYYNSLEETLKEYSKTNKSTGGGKEMYYTIGGKIQYWSIAMCDVITDQSILLVI